MVRLEPGGLVGDHRIGSGVRLVEAVFGELGHQVEQVLGQCRIVALLFRPLGDGGAVRGHFFGFFLAHRPAQHVGPAQRIAADDLRNLHHLFLIHDHAVGRLQAGFQIIVVIVDLLLTFFPQDEVVDHAGTQWAGAVQREHGDDVLEAVGLQLFQQLFHTVRFDLENRRGVGILENLVGLRVVEGQGFQRRAAAGQLLDVVNGQLEDGEVSQAQEVELHQPDFFHVVLVVLRNDGYPGVRRIQRTEIGQLARRDQHAPSVHADVARQVFQPFGEVKKLAHLLFAFDALLELRLNLNRLGQRQGLVGLQRNQLGKLVAEGVRHVEHPPDVADHRLGRHRAEGGNLRHGIMPVVVTHVIDDQSALFLAEVDVEVGHRHPFRVEEAFEQQRVAQGIQIGDAERKGDQRPGPGAAPRPDRHIVVLGPVDEIGNDQEVAGKTHLHDGFRLRAQARLIGRAGTFAFGLVREKQHQTFFQPGHRLLAQEIIERHARRRWKSRQVILAQGDRQIAAPGDLHGIFQRLGQIGEQLAHFRLRLEILLLGIGARAALVAEHIAFGDAHARLVREEIVAVEELDRMRGHQRQIERGRQLRRRRNQCFLLRLSAWMHALDFKIEGVGKAFRPIPGAYRRLLAIPLRERLTDIAQSGSGKRS